VRKINFYFDFPVVCHPRECWLIPVQSAKIVTEINTHWRYTERVNLSPNPLTDNGYWVQDLRIRKDDKIRDSHVTQPDSRGRQVGKILIF
jgi:predicted DCC family thiol-disulfide oxidoreductase YuxK